MLSGLSGLRYQPPPALRSRMIDLSTLAGLLWHRHRLDAYCPRCDRWAALDLAAIVADGSQKPECSPGRLLTIQSKTAPKGPLASIRLVAGACYRD